MKSLLRAAKRLLLPPKFSGSPTAAYGEWWREAARTDRDAKIATIDDLNEAQYQMRGLRGDGNSPGALQLLQWTQTPADGTARVLELGCGIARIGREMAPLVAEWHGMDISTAMIDHARARTAHLPNVHLHHLPATDPAAIPQHPAARQPFDLVYCTVVLMHLDKEDLFAYLQALRSILKPGHRAYFDTWNILHPDTFRIWRTAAKTGDQKPRGRIQCCSPEEFHLYLHQAGWEVERLDRHERLLRAVVRRPETDALPGPYPDTEPLDTSAPRSGAGDTFAPFGYVTGPETGDTVSGDRLTVYGLAMDRLASVSVEIWPSDAAGESNDPLRLATATLGIPRPEAPPLFPHFPEAANCGWTCDLPLDGLPAGQLRIRAIATDSEGLSTDLAGLNLTINHQPGLGQQHGANG